MGKKLITTALLHKVNNPPLLLLTAILAQKKNKTLFSPQ